MFDKQKLEKYILDLFANKYEINVYNIVKNDPDKLSNAVNAINEALPEFLEETLNEHLHPTHPELIVYEDGYPESPREWDNIGTMVCNHRRYKLGDEENPYAGENGSYNEDMKAYFKDKGLKLSDVIYRFINMYDHSGISLSLSEVTASGFDIGCLGFMYVTKEKIYQEFNVKHINSKLEQQIYTRFEAEITTYNHYLSGNVYGFIVLAKDGGSIEDCSGFIGDLDQVIEDMKDNIDSEYKYLFDNFDKDCVIGY